jgi:preprotein translocase subunit SecA
MFESLLDNIKHDVVKILTRVRVREDAPMDLPEHAPQPIEFQHQEFKGFGAESPVNAPQPEQPAEEQPAQPFVRDGRKIGRNEPCPCGSGKKYKQCHGKLT